MRYLKTFLVLTIYLSITNVSYAAANDYFAVGLPWDNLLTLLGNELTGPIPRTMATVFAVMSGLMLCFGEVGGMYKRSLQFVFGAAIALNAPEWISALMGDISPDPSSVNVPMAKAMTEPDFLSSMMAMFKGACMKGALTVTPIVLKLLLALAIIQIALAVSFNFEQDHVKYLFQETLKIGFFAFLIIHWVGGTYGISYLIGQGFEVFGLKAAGFPMADPDQIISHGLLMVDLIWKNTLALGIGSLAVLASRVLIMAGIIISVFMMTLELFITKIELVIIGVVTIPLIPFGIFLHTKWLFEKAIGAIFSIGIKLMAISLTSAISFAWFMDMANTLNNDTFKNTSSISVILQVLLACLALYYINKKAPEMAQGLLSGSPSFSGGSAIQAARGAAQMASMPMGVAKAAMGAAGVMSMAAAMEGGRNENGNLSMGGMSKNLGTMAMAKIKHPYHDAFSNQMHRMSRQGQNNSDMYENKYGKHPGQGASMKRRMAGDRNTDSGSN